MSINDLVRRHERAEHMVGDARKRLLDEDHPSHDEQHAHLHEWPDYDDH